jgi:hypothetical protein
MGAVATGKKPEERHMHQADEKSRRTKKTRLTVKDGAGDERDEKKATKRK